MSHDQCPSTKGKRDIPAARDLPEMAGRPGTKLWRSVDEIAGTPGFRDFLQREFPAGASELLDTSRRDFVKLMGASLALAGAATIPGCRRPDHLILPYSRTVPEEVIPGKPLYYATSFPLPGGGAEGLVVETHEGRPTKIEGNPLHPTSQGRTSLYAQACILGLYDPDRLKFPVFANPRRGRLTATWDDFTFWAREHFEQFDASQGAGLAFIVDKKSSPTLDAMKQRIMARWPRAEWLAYAPVDDYNAVEGSRIAFGRAMRQHLRLDRARVICSIGLDFLAHGPEALPHARQFAAGRAVDADPSSMSRLYAAEAAVTHTGMMADHRFALTPNQQAAFLVALARAVLERTGGDAALRAALDAQPELPVRGFTAAQVDAVADDMLAHRGAAVLLLGPMHAPHMHALVHAINRVLGAVEGKIVAHTPMTDDEASFSAAGIRTIARLAQGGAVRTAVCLGANPVYDAPADAGFKSVWESLTTITLSVDANETAAISTWSLNGQHVLESWGDTRAADGTIAPIQPMIAPLYAPAMSDIELLAFLAGEDEPDGYTLVRETWAALLGDNALEKTWRRALHDGVVANTAIAPVTPPVNVARVAETLAARRLAPAGLPEAMELEFRLGTVHDGRYANYPWLQELPEFATRVCWDNPALVSPATARALGLMIGDDPDELYIRDQIPSARMARLRVPQPQGQPERVMEIAVWVCPGMPDNTIVLHLGYGREVCGHVGTGVGFNTYAVRTSDTLTSAAGCTLERIRGTYPIASTQNHWSLEGRTSIVRDVDLPAWKKYGEKVKVVPDKIYGEPAAMLNFAERLGELSHTPKNVSAYENPFNASRDEPALDKRVRDRLGREVPPEFAIGPQWGMTIDLNTCTGCGVCTVACQSENNIPVVGKREVAKGREMTWIRVDRYFAGDNLDSPESILVQPVACVQCENAPCEVVCPVNATVHTEDGLNAMAYNRCIGTRYCANNCPYKVRRFNFFDYQQAKFQGDFIGEEYLPFGGPKNVNLIPPRLREKLDQIARMRMNPDVTIRGRGVMEKCTYCIQRINRARYELKLQDISPDAMPDGFFEVACQQACPTGAISFGNILDENARVSALRTGGRSYAVLGYLNTRPRTSHLIRVRNPNPALRTPIDDPFGHGGGHGSEGDHAPAEHHDEHAAVFDPAKRVEDAGYALSLRVLGAAAGVHA